MIIETLRHHRHDAGDTLAGVLEIPVNLLLELVNLLFQLINFLLQLVNLLLKHVQGTAYMALQPHTPENLR